MNKKLIFLVFLLNVAGAKNYVYAQTVQATQSKSNSLEAELAADEDLIPAKNTGEKKKDDAEKKEKEKTQMSLASLFSQDLQHSIKGFSIGALAFSQGYTSSVDVKLNGTTSRVASRINDLYYVGGILRYSVFPYERVGTDIGVTIANSMNHSSLNYSAVSFMKTEVNFGYSWITRAGTPTYAYAGLGYESLKSKDFENFAAGGGTSLQVGIGTNYSKNISFEVLYSMSRHPVGPGLYDSITTQATNQGFTSIEIDKEKSYITANLFQGRVLFRF